MKIFISWSGAYSHGVATALKDWLPYLFTGIETFVSSEDIRKGKRWPVEVAKELDQCNFGIVCLTPENLTAPWILFESGALSKSLKDASLYTLLVDGLRPGDIEGPLSHFQHTQFSEDDVYKLVKCINETQGTTKHEEGRLKKLFDKLYDELEEGVNGAKKRATKTTLAEKGRTVDDMLHELLDITTQIAKNIPQSESIPVDLRLASAFRELHSTDDLDFLHFSESIDAALKIDSVTTLGQLLALTDADMKRLFLPDEPECISEIKAKIGFLKHMLGNKAVERIAQSKSFIEKTQQA